MMYDVYLACGEGRGIAAFKIAFRFNGQYLR